MKKLIFLLAFTGLIAQSIYSQSDFKDRINNVEDVCFCDVGLSHPLSLLYMDNNMEILFALKSGATLKDLDKLGIKYTVSQINLLKFSGLVTKKDSVYQSSVPILTENETIQLRNTTRSMAEDIIPLFKDDFASFIASLNSKGLQRNSYSLFFSFILDGLVWDILKLDKEIEPFVISTENPFWDGAFWFMEPKRAFSCGTNTMSSGVYSLCVNWSHNEKISVSSYKILRELLNDYSTNGKIIKAEVFKQFAKNDLFNKDGYLNIPVITAENSDLIYFHSKNVAKKIVGYLRNNIDYSTILPDWKNLTRSQKIIILYHEIMWDILDNMEQTGQISKPIIFANPEQAKEEDLRDLIFVYKE